MDILPLSALQSSLLVVVETYKIRVNAIGYLNYRQIHPRCRWFPPRESNSEPQNLFVNAFNY